MPIPNHQKELTDHIETALVEAYGKDASGGNWIDDPDNNVKNKYSIIREYRQLHLEELKKMVKARMNAVLGVYVLTNVAMELQSKQINKTNFRTNYTTQIYLGTTNLRGNQIGGDRVVYEMNRDLIQVLHDNPIRLTGNPTNGFNITNSDADNTDEEIDFVKTIISIPTAILKDVTQ